jgi:hypothetical protein
MSPESGYKDVYIGGSINSGRLDQTDLKRQHRCNLGGGGESMLQDGG